MGGVEQRQMRPLLTSTPKMCGVQVMKVTTRYSSPGGPTTLVDVQWRIPAKNVETDMDGTREIRFDEYMSHDAVAGMHQFFC